MKLSMWILSDWLKKYNPDNRITEGEKILRGVRLISNEINFESSNIYLGRAKDFISSDNENIICINGHDMILLKTQDIEAVLNDIFDAFDFYNRWADGLVSDIYEGCTIQDLVDKSHEVFNDPITIHDSGNVLTAYSKEYGLGSVDEEWDNIITNKSMSLETLHKMKDHLKEVRTRNDVLLINMDEFSPEFMLKNIFANHKNMGRAVLVLSKHDPTKGRIHLFETFVNIIETWLKFNSERKEMLEENALFFELLSGNQILDTELFTKLKVFGWEEKDKKIVIAISNPFFYSELHRPLLTSLEKNLKNCYILEFKNKIVVVCDIDVLPIEKIKEIIKPLLKRTSSYAAFSYDFTDILKLKIYFDQADLTLSHCPKEEGCIYFCSDFALPYIYDVIRAHLTQTIIHPSLLTLQKFDSETNSELFKTLYEFLIHERNLVKTAAALNIHRNTLIYRLNKIDTITGVDLENEDVRQYLILSFKIFQPI